MGMGWAQDTPLALRQRMCDLGYCEFPLSQPSPGLIVTAPVALPTQRGFCIPSPKRIESEAATLTCYGTLPSNGSLYDDGTLNANGSLNQVGTLDNRGSLFDNGTLVTHGSLFEFGTLHRDGSLRLPGTLLRSGSLVSLGTLYAHGFNPGTRCAFGTSIRCTWPPTWSRTYGFGGRSPYVTKYKTSWK